MKRIISFALILMLAVTAIGCDKLPEEPPSVSPAPTGIPTEIPTEAPTDAPERPILSEMSEEDCIRTLREFGAELPEEPDFDILGMVRDFEEDIGRSYPGDVYFDDEYNLFESVRAAVRAYYEGADILKPAPETTPEPAGTPAPTALPEWPEELPEVIAGDDVFFICDPDGTLYGWGRNDRGQLGLGDTKDRSAPVFIANGLKPVIVGDTVFALSADNILWGWGRNDRGQLALGDTADRLRPEELMHFVTGVYDTPEGVCVLTEIGDLYLLGGSESELLFENVEYFCDGCMIKDGGELWVNFGEWSKRADGVIRVFDRAGRFVEIDGKLCVATRGDTYDPICDAPRSVSLSDGTAYILMDDGSLWSYAMEGDFHEVPVEEYKTLVRVMDGVSDFQCDWYVDEDWGYCYHLALKENGELWSWATPSYNALVGKAEENDSREPACVAEGVRRVITNTLATYIIKYDGTCWATGHGPDAHDFIHGGLGDGTGETRYGFVELGLSGVCGVYSRLTEEFMEFEDGTDGVELYARTFAVDADGQVYAWGWNGDGLLGVNSEEEEVLSPVLIEISE